MIPVPSLEAFVSARWAHHDPGWLSKDQEFTHAHITALSPYLRSPLPNDLRRVGDVVASMRSFDFTLADVDVFHNGCIHLRPEPADPFAELTELLAGAFPMCPPYDGEYEPVPHLTLDQCSGDVTPETTLSALGDVIPATCRAERLEMHWYEEGNCHVREVWWLSDRPISSTALMLGDGRLADAFDQE